MLHEELSKVQIRGSGQSTEVRNREEWKSNAQRVAPPDVAEGHAPPVSIALDENGKIEIRKTPCICVPIVIH